MHRVHFFFIYSPLEINENPRLTLVDFTDIGENVQSEREYFRLGAESYSSLGRVGKKKKIACPLLDVFACGQVSSPRLYRLTINSYLASTIISTRPSPRLPPDFKRRNKFSGCRLWLNKASTFCSFNAIWSWKCRPGAHCKITGFLLLQWL